MKLTTITPTEAQTDPTSSPTPLPETQTNPTPPAPPTTEFDIQELANTSDIKTPPTPSPSENRYEEPLLDDELLLNEPPKPPKRSGTIPDITKNPIATTLAIALLSFSVIGGLALVWWGFGTAQSKISATNDSESIEAIVEDEQAKEIEELQQQLYDERAKVALKDLSPTEEIDTEEDDTDTAEVEPTDAPPPTVATSPTPSTPKSSSPPPPPRRVTPTPVRNSSAVASSSAPPQPTYDSPNQWYELAALGQITTTEFDATAFPPPPISDETDIDIAALEAPTPSEPSGGWQGTGLSVVTVNADSNNPWPTERQENSRSPGEIGILESPSSTPTPEPTPEEPPSTLAQNSDTSTIYIASAKGDPWKTAASAYVSEAEAIVYNADDFWDEAGDTEEGADADIDNISTHQPEDEEEGEWNEPGTIYVEPEAPITTDQAPDWEVAVDPNEGWEDTANISTNDDTWEVAVDPNEGWEDTAEPQTEQTTTTTVAIGTITDAKVITPIVWDMEAPRSVDGIFTIELTDPMEDINGEIVLPKGTRLVGDVSHVTSVGHVYQSIIAIHLPNGEQIPVPIIDHEVETGAPITPLVVRGKKGEALIADPVERSDGNRNSLGNDLLIGAVNGLAEAADNALEPDTTVQVNQGFSGSTVESQENVNDPAAAFARGFLGSTAARMEERLYEETEDILVFQVDAGEKVSVVVNGLMAFNIPAGGWQE